MVGQMGVAGGGEDGAVAEYFLHFQQVDTGFDQVGRVAVAQAVRGEFFLMPQACVTLRKALCTPPRSSGVVAHRAFFRPPNRLGNNRTGLRCTCQ